MTKPNRDPVAAKALLVQQTRRVLTEALSHGTNALAWAKENGLEAHATAIIEVLETTEHLLTLLEGPDANAIAVVAAKADAQFKAMDEAIGQLVMLLEQQLPPTPE